MFRNWRIPICMTILPFKENDYRMISFHACLSCAYDCMIVAFTAGIAIIFYSWHRQKWLSPNKAWSLVWHWEKLKHHGKQSKVLPSVMFTLARCHCVFPSMVHHACMVYILHWLLYILHMINIICTLEHWVPKWQSMHTWNHIYILPI